MALEAKPAANSHLPEEALEKYAFGRLPHSELAHFETHLLICAHCQQRLETEDNFAEAMLMLGRMEQTATKQTTTKQTAAVFTFPRSASTQAPASPSASRALRASLGLKRISPAWNSHSPNLSLGRDSLGRNLTRAGLKLGHAPAWGAGLLGILAVGFGIAAWRLPVRLSSGRATSAASSQAADAVILKTLRGGSADGMAEAKPNRPLELAIDLREIAGSPPETGPYRLEVVDAAGNQTWTGAAISSVSGKLTARIEKRLAPGLYWVRLSAPSGKLLREFGLHLG